MKRTRRLVQFRCHFHLVVWWYRTLWASMRPLSKLMNLPCDGLGRYFEHPNWEIIQAVLIMIQSDWPTSKTKQDCIWILNGWIDVPVFTDESLRFEGMWLGINALTDQWFSQFAQIKREFGATSSWSIALHKTRVSYQKSGRLVVQDTKADADGGWPEFTQQISPRWLTRDLQPLLSPLESYSLCRCPRSLTHEGYLLHCPFIIWFTEKYLDLPSGVTFFHLSVSFTIAETKGRRSLSENRGNSPGWTTESSSFWARFWASGLASMARINVSNTETVLRSIIRHCKVKHASVDNEPNQSRLSLS